MKLWFYKIWRSWNPWYILEVDHRGRTKRIIVKDFKKKTPKHIKGKDMDGRAFEIRTVEPFDYQIRKIY